MPDPFRYPFDDNWHSGKHLELREYPVEPLVDPTPPPWWEPATEPCEHTARVRLFRYRKILDEDSGRARGSFVQWECPRCGHRWCDQTEEYPPPRRL